MRYVHRHNGNKTSAHTHTFTNPFVFEIGSTNDEHKPIAGDIVGVKEIRHEPQQAQAPCQDHEFILGAELCEKLLLKFLQT